MKKGLLIGLGVAAGVVIIAIIGIGLIIGLVMNLTSGIVDSTEAFFDEVAAENWDDAYDYCSTEFKRSTSLETLKGFMQNSTLSDYEKAWWNSREIDNNKGHLEGTITTRDGGKVPVEVYLVKEDKDWKILRIEKAKSGLSDDDDDEDEDETIESEPGGLEDNEYEGEEIGERETGESEGLGEPVRGTIDFAEVLICKSMMANYAPGEVVDCYAPEDETFYCSVRVTNVPEAAKFTGRWFWTENVAGESMDQLVDTTDITIDEPQYLGFSLTRSNDAWPRGKFVFELLVNDEIRSTKIFYVK